MSKPNAPRRRDKYLDALPFRRSRSKSPAQSGPPTSNAPASGPTVTVTPAPPTTPPQSNQATAPKTILREDVLDRLEPEHQKIIRDHCTVSDPLDISASMKKAIDAAEEKKQLCIKKQWRMTIGGRTIVLRDKVNTVVDLISKFKDIGSIAVGADPVHAGLPWAGVCLLLQVAIADKEQMDALMNGLLVALSSQQTADLYLGYYNDQLAGAHADNLRVTLLRLYATILAFLAEALRLWNASGPSRFGNALLGDDGLRKFPSSCRERLEDVGSAMRLCDRQLDERTAELVAETKQSVADIVNQLELLRAEAARTGTKIDLAKLPIAAGARHDAYKQPDLSACLQGTRVDLLDDITRWANNTGEECFFWLQGNAGEGKSTIAKTVAETLQRQDKLGASFFFKRGDAGRGSARSFFSTIAAQLAEKIDGLKGAIAEVLDSETSKYDKSMQTQFEDLIAAPLQKIGQSTSGALIVVVDALDECYDGDIKQLIDLLAQAGSLSIRTFVTSRPEAPVAPTLANLGSTVCRTVILETHTQATIGHDISLFLTQQFDILRTTEPTLAHDWPGQDCIEELTRRSVPLFIFAATICLLFFTPGYTPREVLKTVLQEPSRLPFTMTYRPVLDRWLIARTQLRTKEEAIAEFRNIVGPVLFSAEPLPLALAVPLSGLEVNSLKARLQLLRSVLQTSKNDGEADCSIKRIHLSFQDFVTKSDDCLDFRINEQQVHESMAAASLSLMMQPGKLRQDICAMRKPGTRRVDVDLRVVNEHIEPDLAYACRHWLSHQVRSGKTLDDTHEIYLFLTRNFLYWFEAMAWLGKVYEMLPVLRQLKPLIEDTGSVKLRELFEDVHYFIRDFSYIADQAPLQLYASALVFAPESSQIKVLFKNLMPQWIAVPPKVADVWEMDSLALEGNSGRITAMSFSSREEFLATGKEFLAICSTDGTLRVWDTATGDCTLKIQIPGPDRPIAVAVSFSHDGKYLAAACQSHYPRRDYTVSIIIYDVKTGNSFDDYHCNCSRAEIFEDLQDPDVKVRLAFAPDPSNTLFVVTLNQGLMEVWRSKHGAHTIEQIWSMRIRVRVRGDFVISASNSFVSCFSRDDSRIISWHLESGAYVSTHSIGEIRFKGFIDCGGRDVIYRLSELVTRTHGDVGFHKLGVNKLNIRTGHVEQVTSVEETWRPEAISLDSGAMAMAKHYTFSRTVYIVGLSQRLKTASLTRNAPAVHKVTVAQNGEMILLQYRKHLELRDVQGNVVFRSSEVDVRERTAPYGSSASMSRDGSVVIAQLRRGTHVWFVKSGRELQLPYMTDWSCSPAVSGDGTSMAFRFKIPIDSSLEHTMEVTYNDSILLWDLENNQEVKVVNRNCMRGEPWMVFSEDNKTLHTDNGDLDLETCGWKTNSLHNRDEPKNSISRNDSWLQLNYKDMLWLPEPYRPRSGSRLPERQFWKNMIAYERDDGNVMTMRWADPCE